MKIISFTLCLTILLVSSQFVLAAGSTYKAEMLVTTGKKTKELKTSLNFEEEYLKITLPKDATSNKEFKYTDIKSAEYSFAKKPLLSTGGAIATAILLGLVVIPFLFMKKKQHWMTVRTENDFAVLKLDKENYRQVIAEFETHNIKVVTITEDSKSKDTD